MAKYQEEILKVENLKKYFPITKGFLKKTISNIKAVDDVSFSVRKGETLGLVGESGCGKTTLGRCVLRAIEPTGGNIRFKFNDNIINYSNLDKKELKETRKYTQMIFQDPFSSLDPRMTVLDIIREPLKVIDSYQNKSEQENRVKELVATVGLDVSHLKRYPHSFSGGQRQRIGIARALAPNPRFIVADEPVSALDVSVQAQIINLLKELQVQFNLTFLFISHDLSVVEHMCDRVAIMYVGKMVEIAPTEDLYLSPKHPYTQALMSVIPKPDPALRGNKIILSGEVPSPSNPPTGCYFHPRCDYAIELCHIKTPEWKKVAEDHWVFCHRAEELNLPGVITVA